MKHLQPTGPAAAAREIRLFVIKAYGSFSFIERIEATNIEAIILKHCPDDKAVGKLVEACHKMAGFLLGWQDCLAGVQMTIEEFKKDSGIEEAKAALADHEKVKQ